LYRRRTGFVFAITPGNATCGRHATGQGRGRVAPISTAAVVFTNPKFLVYKELRRIILGWPGVSRCRSVARLLVFEENTVRPRESLLL
jgi:hypothetical protein